MSTPDRFPLTAWAYELIPGDMVDGREVVKVADPDRPADGLPMGDGTVTVTYSKGEPQQMDRMASVSLTRDAATVLARLEPAEPDS